MTKLSKKVIGVDVGSKFLTVSLNDLNNCDQVYNIENNQRSILSFLDKISLENYCLVIESTGNYSSRI
ncbi:IS110 family transposase, partial [Chryseobacterium sp. APV1]|nr:IS110 family transposase [Chryseobacterium sp. APV1]